MRVLRWFAGIAAAALVVATGWVLATQPEEPASDSQSAPWLSAGAYRVGIAERTFVDESRPTAANGDFAGESARTLSTRLWFPEDAPASHPLIVYSHGFMSNREGGTYIAKSLASHGYVVAAPDYPLTHRGAPGGPEVTDVMHQPADVSFLITTLLRTTDSELPFAGKLDESRIGVVGISLGGLTSTLVTYHKQMKDSRIAAAVSIAGPAYMFTPEFFKQADVPFLMIAGTVDALIDYQTNAATIPQRFGRGSLVSISRGSHTSFVDIAEPALRWMSNPDELGCAAVLANVSDGNANPESGADKGTDAVNPLSVMADESAGIVFDPQAPGLCERDPLPESLHPGRQHMITQIAVLSFFEHYFAQNAERRAAAYRQLAEMLQTDFNEATVTIAARD